MGTKVIVNGGSTDPVKDLNSYRDITERIPIAI